VEGFSNKSAWWAFNRLGTLTAQRWGDMRHDVDAIWNPIQQELFERQPSFEQQAVQMYKQDHDMGRAFLTSYTNHWGVVVVDNAWKLGDYLWTKYDEKW
jgi:dipeptidase